MVLLVLAAVVGWPRLDRMMREHPERFPWTELSLKDPIGPFTGIKLARLTDNPGRCMGVLGEAQMAEIAYRQPVPAVSQCRFNDGVRIRPEDRGSTRYAPDGLVTSCPVAAALALWERDVVQAAASHHFGSRIVRIDHAGSYNCRQMYGRPDGPFSEHATADAVDITGFQLADGRRVVVLRDWRGDPAERAFLREVRDGACDVFATVLSPDYNAAHADHFHLDEADRGAFGWRMCR